MVQTHDGSPLEKSDTGCVPLVITGLVLILLAGFDDGITTWLDYLDYGFLAGGVAALILAALEFRGLNKTAAAIV